MSNWIDDYELRFLVGYLKKNNYQHALVTKNGVSFSTGTITEYESVILQKDAAYAERNKCISLIARMAIALGLEAGLGKHDENDKTWEADWRNIVFVDLPSGQVSWHVHNSDMPMFEFLGEYDKQWDGHTTEEKYRRVLSARFNENESTTSH